MDAAAPTPLQDTDLQGWKYFRRLKPLLARLHKAGCQRDKAGNRSLHLDQYCTLILLALFQPAGPLPPRPQPSQRPPEGPGATRRALCLPGLPVRGRARL